MKKLFLLFALISFGAMMNAQTWSVLYECNEIPTLATPAWEESNSYPKGASLSTWTIESGILHAVAPEGDRLQFKTSKMLSYPNKLTVAAKIKMGDSATCDIETRGFNYLRESIRIGGNKADIVALNYSGLSLTLPDIGLSIYDWHTYWLTYDNGTIKLYLDDLGAILEGTTSSVDSTTPYIRLGDPYSSGSIAQEYWIDWIGYDTSAATAPSFVANKTAEKTARIFPVPTQSQLTVDVPSSYLGSTMRIVDIFGRTILNEVVTSTMGTLDVNFLTSGTYIFTIKSNNGETLFHQTFVK